MRNRDWRSSDSATESGRRSPSACRRRPTVPDEVLGRSQAGRQTPAIGAQDRPYAPVHDAGRLSTAVATRSAVDRPKPWNQVKAGPGGTDIVRWPSGTSGRPRRGSGPTLLARSTQLCQTATAGAARIMAVDTAETPPASAYADADAPEPELAPEHRDPPSRQLPGGCRSGLAILLGTVHRLGVAAPGHRRRLRVISTTSSQLSQPPSPRRAARGSADDAAAPMRLAWTWIGASAACWAVGEAIVTWYELVSGRPVPFPSVADAGLPRRAAAGRHRVLLFPSPPTFGISRARCSSTAASWPARCLIVSWTTALGTVYHSGSGSVFSQAVGLAYPIGDVIVATVGISVLAQGRGRRRSRSCSSSPACSASPSPTAVSPT